MSWQAAANGFVRLLIAWCAISLGRAGMVVMSEIHYDSRPDAPEYIVVSNPCATVLDIAEWEFTEGIRFTFPAFESSRPQDTFLRAFESVVVTGDDPEALRQAYTLPDEVRVFGPWKGKLDNDGERVTLRDKNRVIVCSVKYARGGRWPTPSPGQPLTIENADRAADDWRNWVLGQIAFQSFKLEQNKESTGTSAKWTRQSLTRTGPEVSSSQLDPLSLSPVIITEIMFDPPPTVSGLEFVELYNRGTNDVDLSGFCFTEGIRFTIPKSTILASGGFLVVAKNTAQLRSIHGDIPIVGNFTNRLNNRGEMLRLDDAMGQLVDEVDFRTEGDWPIQAGGRGSSLELIHPETNNDLSSAWADSDESSKSSFARYRFKGTYEELHPLGKPSDYKELHMYLVGPGHLVLRNFGLWSGDQNLLSNCFHLSSNGSGAGGWLCQGTHWVSYFTNDEFHLISDGRGDNRANRVEIDVPALVKGKNYELHFEARWLSGKPRLIAQTWDLSFATSFLLAVPPNLGSPGKPNARAAAPPPPQVDHLRHYPAVPRSSDPVTIQAQVFSVSPLASIELIHRVDSASGNGAWSTTQMRDDGGTGDRLQGGRSYSAQLLDYQTNGLIVQFFVKATSIDQVVSVLPRGGDQRPAMFIVDDTAIGRDIRTERFVISEFDRRALLDGNTSEFGFRFPRFSNHYFNMTFISNEEEIFYGAGIRATGSPFSRDGDLSRAKWRLPADRPWRGRTQFSYDDDQSYHNRVARYLLYLLGHPANENEWVRLKVNHWGPYLREETEPVGSEFLDRIVPHGAEGDLYRIDEQWWLTDGGQRASSDTHWRDQGDDAALYRVGWMKRSNESRDDFSHLIGFFRIMSTGDSSREDIERWLDPVATLQYAAVRGYIGDWDTFTLNRGKNAFLYRRPTDGRYQFLHWDSDMAFSRQQPLYGERIKSWIEKPYNQRMFREYIDKLMSICGPEGIRLKTWLEAEEQAIPEHSPHAAFYLEWFRLRNREVKAMLGKNE